MKYVTAKTAADIKLDGITIGFDKVESALQAVYFRDAKGNTCRVVLSSYSMSAQIPAPPTKEKRYVLRGDLPVLGTIERTFVEKYEAETAERDLTAAIRGDAVITITCEEVEIVEDAQPVADPIPF